MNRVVGLIAVLLTAGRGGIAQEVAATQPVAQADTVSPAGVTDTAYTFTNDSLTLAGTLTLAAGAGAPVPVAVIVAGSGPTDRNGNSASGGLRSNSYAQLAWRLAERGIASLRYDKRVLPATRGNFDYTALTFDDFAGDLAAAARALAADERFSKVVVVGHSEGAGLAIRAVNNGLEVSGIALVSGAGRTLVVLVREQLSRQLDDATLVVFDSAMARYLRGEPTGDVPGALLPLLAPVNRTYMRSLDAFEPAVELARTSVPVLIVQGTTDLQVRMTDANALQAARTDARLVVLPDVNHVLKLTSDTTIGGQLVTYTDPTTPIVSQVVEAIASWIGGLP
jgi:pimeloyl-ACP methyl ester carboxylesterase